MNVWREFDAKRLNEIANHPDVRGDVADTQYGALDLTDRVANKDNILLVGEHGCIFFARFMPGIYECHTLTLPDGRGRWVFGFTKACAAWMFTKSDAYEIGTRIPTSHHAARYLAVMTGMTHDFTRQLGTVWRGQREAVDIYSFRLQEWARKAREFGQAGFAFHSWLHEEAERIGVTDEPHADDPNHNQYLGIAIAMLQNGYAVKAAQFYNRWALFARHRPIQLLSVDPVRVRFDIGDLVFEKNGVMRVEGFEKAA